MAKVLGVTPDSAAFKVLMRLYERNGSVPVVELMDTLWSQYRTTDKFLRTVVQPLEERGLADFDTKTAIMTITSEGRLMVESYRRRLPATREQTKPVAVYNPAKHFNWGQTRPGALDYRKAPSLMGGERVPFHGSDEEIAG